MATVHKFKLRNKIVIDPAVEAFYALENAWSRLDGDDTPRTQADVDRAYEVMADTIPTTRDGARHKIQLCEELASSMGAYECECGCAKIDERFEQLLTRNLETLAQGFDAIRA